MKVVMINLRRLATVVLVSAVAAGITVPVAAQQQEAVRIGTSSLGSALYTLAIGVSQLMKKYADVNSTVEPVGGSSANMFAIAANRVDFAISNQLAAYDAYHGRKPYRRKTDLMEVAQAQTSFRMVIASKKSGIRTPADLRGKRLIGARPALPEIALITDAMLKVYGIPKNAVHIVTTTNSGEALKSLKAGTVDAVVLPASPHAPNVASLAQQIGLVFLSFPKDKLDAMTKLLPPALGEGIVEKGMYKGMDNDVRTLTVGTVMVAARRVPDDIAYRTAKAIFEHTKEFATMHRSARAWTVKHALADPKLPFHPGVIRYFKEIGAWTPRNEEIQKMRAAR